MSSESRNGLPEVVRVLGDRARGILADIRRDPTGSLLMLDFDGTVAAIHPDPDSVVVLPGVVGALSTLARRGARVAIVTGRPAHFPVTAAGLGDVPGIVVHGRHGVEVWQDGRLTAPDPDPAVASARGELEGLLATGPAGMRVEDKILSVAIHTRGCEDPAGALRAVRPYVDAVASRLGLEILAGRYVWELRPPGEDKGDAVRSLVAGLRPRRVAVFGDDIGDVPAFRAVRAAAVEGLAVAVASSEVPDVAAAADEVLPGPEAVRDLLVWLASGGNGVPS